MLRTQLTVGLTGGIGSGKSEALKAFRRAGAETISLDEIAHALSEKGRPVYRALLRVVGKSAVGSDGRIDRKAVARRVFSDWSLRVRVEAATHPAISREMRSRLRKSRRSVTVVDVPLLFETGMQKNFDLTVAVTAGKELRVGRVRRRDGATRGAALRRMRAQFPQGRRASLADVVLPNEGTLTELGRRVREYQKAFQLIAESLPRKL